MDLSGQMHAAATSPLGKNRH